MKITNEFWSRESTIVVRHKRKTYIRKESEMNGGFHTISWTSEDGEKLIHYFTSRIGWGDSSGHLNPDQPAPEVEVEFQKLRMENL